MKIWLFFGLAFPLVIFFAGCGKESAPVDQESGRASVTGEMQRVADSGGAGDPAKIAAPAVPMSITDPSPVVPDSAPQSPASRDAARIRAMQKFKDYRDSKSNPSR
jgi:hypothetical protein